MPRITWTNGHGKETSVLDLAQTIIRITGSKSQIVHHAPLKEGDMLRRMPDNSKMKALLNRELVSLEEGLKKTIASGNF